MQTPLDNVADLLIRVAEQDRLAFRQLYRETSAKLYGMLLRMLGNRAEAEDVLQETYTRVWLHARRYDQDRGAGIAWIIAIGRNLAIDRLRARTREGTADAAALDTLADGAAPAEARLAAEQAGRKVLDCLGQLPADRAEAVKGAYLAGLSYQALADRHDVPLNTMRTWLRRALLKLRECIDR
ncbi:MAG: sigma-70 family RNA polymerase sigma factor [Rhodobacterales bacterium]|nr:sigma-70 family RNA polymerase sigma factor [Rhodobacterales bacterium]